MSARARCSTGWPGGGWRWSPTRPASRATARRPRRCCAAGACGWSTPPGWRRRRRRRWPGGCATAPGWRPRSADLVLFVVDARAGVTPADRHFAQWLRRQGRPVLLVANKAEGRSARSSVLDAFELGLGEPVAVSAEHGEGISDLMAEIADRLPEAEAGEADEDGPAAEARHRRAAERGEVHAAEPAARRGADADRAGAGPDARRGRGGAGGPGRADRAGRYRRPAAAGADRGAAGEAVGRCGDRRAEAGRGGGAGGGRDRGAARPGPADRPADRARGPRLRAGAEQVGRGGGPAGDAAGD